MKRLLALFIALLVAGCTDTPPTASPSPSPAARPVSFTAADGVTLSGRLYGAGPKAVILSNMGDNSPSAWDGFAPELAERGYLVLTYSYRYTTFTSQAAQATVSDLQGAIAYLKAQHATRIVLIGASMGAMASAKVAGGAGVAAAVLMAGRLDLSAYGFAVTPAELASLTMPKLILTSDDDDTTDYALTREMFDKAPEPKQFHSYAGTAHGVRIFATKDGPDLMSRLIGFVETHMPIAAR